MKKIDLKKIKEEIATSSNGGDGKGYYKIAGKQDYIYASDRDMAARMGRIISGPHKTIPNE